VYALTLLSELAITRPNVRQGVVGTCHDRYDRPGAPYFALKAIRPGEELLVCYGHIYPHRNYETICADEQYYSEYMAQSPTNWLLNAVLAGHARSVRRALQIGKANPNKR